MKGQRRDKQESQDAGWRSRRRGRGWRSRTGTTGSAHAISKQTLHLLLFTLSTLLLISLPR